MASDHTRFISASGAINSVTPAVCRTMKPRGWRCCARCTTPVGRRTKRGVHSALKTSIRPGTNATRHASLPNLPVGISSRPRRWTVSASTGLPARSRWSASTTSCRSARVCVHNGSGGRLLQKTRQKWCMARGKFAWSESCLWCPIMKSRHTSASSYSGTLSRTSPTSSRERVQPAVAAAGCRAGSMDRDVGATASACCGGGAS
mmetsp:Transcript_25761/g.78300  ORF Transcript_25761/g.78300 Transcript_25761/m.78300 type:complete len:204 (-) Transcript_25761:197-808(-)|eukprot:scaffold38047_cov32-Tisochrysis_lutea.AAC.2